jgi:hypothetical protein
MHPAQRQPPWAVFTQVGWIDHLTLTSPLHQPADAGLLLAVPGVLLNKTWMRSGDTGNGGVNQAAGA